MLSVVEPGKNCSKTRQGCGLRRTVCSNYPKLLTNAGLPELAFGLTRAGILKTQPMDFPTCKEKVNY
jgi:hypothetical protein